MKTIGKLKWVVEVNKSNCEYFIHTVSLSMSIMKMSLTLYPQDMGLYDAIFIYILTCVVTHVM